MLVVTQQEYEQALLVAHKVNLALESENHVLRKQLKTLEKIMSNFYLSVKNETCLDFMIDNKAKKRQRVAEYDSNDMLVNLYSSQLNAHERGADKLSTIQYAVANSSITKKQKWRRYDL